MAEQLLTTALTWAIAGGLFAVGTVLVVLAYRAGQCLRAACRWCSRRCAHG